VRVLIIHDALDSNSRPDELDTVAQATAIAAALTRRGHNPEFLPVGLDLSALRRRLAAGDVDVVFNSMESLGGHGKLVASAALLVESLGIPLAGCRGGAIHLTTDKLSAKSLLAGAGLPTPPWTTLTALENGASFDLPAILKSVWEHSSVGLDDQSIIPAEPTMDAAGSATHRQRLAAGLRQRLPSLGGEGFAEAFVEGREIVVGVLPAACVPGAMRPARTTACEPAHVLPLSEIRFERWPKDRPRLVGYSAKWAETSPEAQQTVPTFEFPAADAPLLALLTALAGACWSLFDPAGAIRVDFRVDAAGRPWILEVNANPCLTPGAGFPRMLERAGLDYDGVIEALAATAIARRQRAGAGEVVVPAPIDSAAVPSAIATRARASRTCPSLLWRDDPSGPDVDAVRRVVASTGYFTPEEIAVAADLVEETLRRGADEGYRFTFVDEPGGDLAGYACYGRIPLTQHSWDLYWIVVAPRHQGAGLGRQLVAAVSERVRGLGGRQLYAETSGRAQYAPTRAFYERTGWNAAARLPDFYAAGDDKLIYIRLVGED